MKFLLSSVVVAFTLTLVSVQVSADFQSLTLCDSRNCDGESEIIKTSIRDISKVSGILKSGNKIVEVCSSGHSLWTLHTQPDYGEVEDGTEEHADHDVSKVLSGTTCTSGGSPLSSFRHVGNIETHKSGLSLYTDKNYNGGELYFDGDILELPYPITVKSFGFTGADRWELYAGNELDGLSKCLQRFNPDALESPFADSDYDRMAETNSLMRGCLHERNTNKEIHPANPPRKENIRTMSALSLYTEKDRKGRKLFIDGLEVRLPKVANFSSFTGYGTWQTFTGRDFDGNTTCLTKFTNSNFQGVDDDDVLQVGSIKLGCGHPINEFEDYEDDDVSSAPVYKSSSVILLTYAMALIIFK